MRTIKFKAKRVDNGEWVEGGLWCFDGSPERIDEAKIFLLLPDEKGIYNVKGIDVDPETVCQFICTQDGIDFWEGDIVENADGDERLLVWAFYGFETRLLDGSYPENKIIWHFHLKQTGRNIHDG